jgi:hypothetical protein
MTVYAVVSASSFYFVRGVLIMPSKPNMKKRKQHKRKPELTHRDIEALMGIHGQVLERHNHALRRKGR